ncbi:MAG: hypothetical protein WD399_03115 [Thermoleophilaceae bacterium]
MPDLALDERNVKVGREQHHRDVGAAKGVRGDVRQRRQPVRDQSLSGERGGGADDPVADVAGVPAPSLARAEEVVVGIVRVAGAELVGAMGEQHVAQRRGDLDVADAGRCLAVGDP